MDNLTPVAAPSRPELSLPPQEAAMLQETYAQADVILEYGSGGSTVLASEMANKLVFSVESDRDWALNIQHYIDTQPMPSPAILHYVNIGEVGAWGRPMNPEEWTKFHRYPLTIWERPFFRHPDVVLIDGRFRAACLAVTRLKITRPVTVLFDDYRDRQPYHAVERLVGAPKLVGRMAIFEVDPAPLTADIVADFMSFMTQTTYAESAAKYKLKGPKK